MKKFALEDCKLVSTPMITGCKLCKEDETLLVNQTVCGSMIGILLYITTSIPNIMQTVCLMTIFKACPHESHVIVVNFFFKYLQGTTYYGLWYSKRKEFKLKDYADVDWEGNINDRKSTFGETFFFGNCLVSYVNKKQDSISLSTAKAEYIATTTCYSQIL